MAVDAARAVNQRQAREFTIGHCACTSPQLQGQIRIVQKVRFPTLRLKISANFTICTEWTLLPASRARKEVNKRRRHFNMSQTAFVSQMGNDLTTTNPRDVLVDESKQADIENLGDCLRALGGGLSLGEFSLSIVLYGDSKADVDQLAGEFMSVFTNAHGNLFTESYNQLNAYFATVPGNYALNLRKLYLLNSNYTDLSFLLTILPGETRNAHLGAEYLAVLETDNRTPYFLNLHNGEVAHTLMGWLDQARAISAIFSCRTLKNTRPLLSYHRSSRSGRAIA
jgi:hypothetical protein